MYQIYMLKDRNQNRITTLLQDLATFLKQCGREFINVGQTLASIGSLLFAAGGFLSLIF